MHLNWARENAVNSIQSIFFCLFLFLAIEEAVGLAIDTYTYFPTLDESYSVLDFSHEKQQYEKAKAWADSTNPKKINKHRTC